MKTTKQCTKCKQIKDLSEYRKRRSDCLLCDRAKTREYKRSKEGLVSVIYSNQKVHSKSRGHRLPEYSKQELHDWLYAQKLFHELYSEWVMSGYTKRLVPSIDRHMDTIHYCFNNIHLCTFDENNKKSNNGTYKAGHGHKTSGRWKI